MTAVIECLTFVRGLGSKAAHTACLMSAARIMAGEATEADERSDACSRVSPDLRSFAIGVNDWGGWASDEERTAHLCRLVPALLDTLAPRDVVQRRLWIMADVAVRVCVPIALDSRADNAERRGEASLARRLRDHTARIRACDAITDRLSAFRAKEICKAAAYATDVDAYAAAAHAAAHAVASPTNAQADGEAAYTAVAAAAAYVYADAAYTDAAYADRHEQRRVAIRDALVSTLARVCEVRA